MDGTCRLWNATERDGCLFTLPGSRQNGYDLRRGALPETSAALGLLLDEEQQPVDRPGNEAADEVGSAYYSLH